MCQLPFFKDLYPFPQRYLIIRLISGITHYFFQSLYFITKVLCLFISRFNFGKFECLTLCEKGPYSEFFWSVFYRIRIDISPVFSLNEEKCRPEKLRIRTFSRSVKSSEIYFVRYDFVRFCEIFLLCVRCNVSSLILIMNSER